MRPRDGTRNTQSRQRRSSTLVLTVLASTGIVVSLQSTLVVPLLPEFPRLLDTSSDNASWLVTATLLAGAVAIPAISRLADMFGKKRMTLVALAVTCIGSGLGAVADALPLFIAARALQGVGMALIPVGIAIMHDELPRDRVPLGVALMSASMAIGAAAGLPLGGLIGAHMDWHSIFWITGLAGALTLVAVWFGLSESPVRSRGSFDYCGALLLSTALTAVLLVLSKGGSWGWTSPMTLLLGGLGLVLVLVWLPVELRARNPFVDVRVAARPRVLLVNLASILMGFAMFMNLLVGPELLQLPPSTGFGLGLGVFATGLAMAPACLMFGVMAPVSAWLTRRFGALTTLFTGAAVVSGMYVVRAFHSHELWQIIAGSMLVAIGTSMTFAAMPILIMRAVLVTETASANGLNTLLRTMGTSASSATMAAVTSAGFAQAGGASLPSFGALMSLFWVSAVAAFVAGALIIPLFRMRGSRQETREVPDPTPAIVIQGSRRCGAVASRP